MLSQLMLVALATAEPAYLACEIPQEGGKLAVEVALDEASQGAVVTLPKTGYVSRGPTVWSASKVEVAEKDQRWIIDRATGEITRTFSFSANVEKGTCTRRSAPAKRVF